MLTHPFDVLKTQQQASASGVHTTSGTTSTASGILIPVTLSDHPQEPFPVSLQSLHGRGGIAAMYRGLLPRLATVVPAGAIMVSVYELVKTLSGLS